MICLVDLGTYCRFKGHLRIKDGTWSCVRSLSCCVCACVWVQLFCSPCNPLTPRHGFLLPLICLFYMGQGCYLFTCSVTWYSDPCPTWHIWQLFIWLETDTSFWPDLSLALSLSASWFRTWPCMWPLEVSCYSISRAREVKSFVLQYSKGVSSLCLLNTESLLLPFL